MEKELKDIEVLEDDAVITENEDGEWDEDLYGEDLEDEETDEEFVDTEVVGKNDDEDLQNAYTSYSQEYELLANLLSEIIESGEITDENKSNLNTSNEKYENSYVVVKEEIVNAQNKSLEKRLDDLKNNMLTTKQEDVFNALTNNGTIQGLYKDENGEIYINAQFLQTRGLNVVNDDNKVTLKIDDDGNLTTSGDIVGGTITGATMNAMTINTNTVNITSEDGGMTLEGALQKFSDENGNVRIQIGKDEDGLFKFILYGEDGETVLIDKNGIKTDAIQAGTINVDHLNANVINAIDAKIKNATIDKATIGELNATNAKIESLKSNKADIGELNATNANIGTLTSNVAKINTLLAGNITADNIQAGTITADKIATGAITAGSGIIADGAIGSAQISDLDASKITAGKIDTSKVEVAGVNNHLRLKGNRIQVFQGVGSQAKERVSLGDVNGDGSLYGLRVRGADGKTVLLDENGVKPEGITDGSITNNKISEDANIDGAKLNINSVINKINNDGTETINGTKIEIDGQTLNAKLSNITIKQNQDSEKINQAMSEISANTNSIKLKVDSQTYQTDKKNMTSQMDKNTSEISTMKGQIALKVGQTEIENTKNELGEIINSKVNDAKSEIKITTDTISNSVSKLSNTVSTKADGSTVSTISDKVGKLETSVNGISGKVSSVETTTSSLKTDVTTLTGKVNTAQSTANTANNTANTNKGSITNLQADVKTVKSDVASLDINLQGITQRVASTESTTSSLSGQVNGAISNASSALNMANAANTLANSKAKVFTSTPTTPYKIGDLWVQGSTGDMMKCKTARSSGNYVASDWEKASKYTDDTKANAVDGRVTTLQGTVTSTSNKVATIETNLNGITQRVSSTESSTATLTTKVNNAQSTADSATTKANNAQNTANTANSTANANKGSISALQTTVNNTSSKVSSLETNLSGITQRVSATETSTTTVSNKLDNLKIGGRNLARGTSTPITLSNFKGSTNYCSGSYTIEGINLLKVDDVLTISYDFEYTNLVGNTGKEIYLHGWGEQTNWDGCVNIKNANPNIVWGNTAKQTTRVVSSMTVNTQTLKNNKLYLRFRTDNITGGSFTVKNFMVERADKPSEWSPAPEDVDSSISTVNGKVDTANKNISSLTSRVSTAESKLTKDSLTTTIGSHYTTKNDVEGVVTAKGYQTQSQVQQTVNSLQAKFTSSGGYNLLRNGCAKNGTAYWSNNGGGISVGTAGSGNGLGEGATYFSSSFPSGITGEWVTLKPNTDYIYSAKLWSASSFTGSTVTPLHFWCSSTKVSGNTQLTVIDYKSECKANEWNDVYVHFRTKGGTVYFKPFVYLGGTTSINFSVSEIMLCEGMIKCPYSPHPSEVYDGITTIDKDGITVIASNVKSKTSMSANGFKITKTDTNEDVFKVGSDGKLIMTGDIQGSTFSSTSGDFKVLDDGTVDATSLSVEDEVSTDTLNVEYISNTKYQAVIDRNYEVHINPWYDWESEGLEHHGHYKSLSSFIDVCPRNLNGYNITVSIWSDLTESVNFNMFNNGILTLQLNGYTIYGYIVCNNHSMRYRIYGNNSGSTGTTTVGSIMPNTGFSATGGYYSLMGSYTHLTVYDMKLYGGKASGNNNGLCITNLSKCYANNVQFVGCYSGIRSYSVSNTYVSSSSGLTTNVAFYAGSGSTIALNNTNQAGRSGSTNHTGTANNGQVLSSGATFSSSAVSGSNTTTSTPTVTKTATITANYGDTYRKTVYNNWKRDGSVRQGEWNNYGDCVGAWFFGEKISSYSDKNITGVSITIKRQAGGSSSAVTHTLKMHDHETRPSGSPTFRSDFSKDFSVATNKSTTINLSSSEITAFKKCKGLGLVPKAYNSTYYSVCSGSITVKITYKE